MAIVAKIVYDTAHRVLYTSIIESMVIKDNFKRFLCIYLSQRHIHFCCFSHQ